MFFVKFLWISLFLNSIIFSQTLRSELKGVFIKNQENILGSYLNPLSRAFGENLGSAIYYNAVSHSFPHFDIGISYLTSRIPKKEFYIGDSQRPSVFGGTSNDTLNPSGLNMSSMAIPVIQFSIGLGDNTNLFVRLTEWHLNKIGEISVYAGGIKYELENLLSITPIPLDIAVLAMYQKFTVENFLEGAVFTMSIVGSKELGFLPLQFYGGAGFLKNITEVTDPANDSAQTISIGGLEEIKYQIGLNYSILFVNLSIEYNFGDFKTLSSGLRIIL